MDAIRHDEIGYNIVKKDFYTESEEIAKMDPEIVKMVR